MNTIFKNTDYKPSAGFVVLTGTTANKSGIAVRKLEYSYGKVKDGDRVNMIAIDAEGITTTFPIPMVNKKLMHLSLGPAETVACPIHDPDTLAKAEVSGNLWQQLPDWHLKPGVARDNLGSGGNPRTGATFGRVNRNRITQKLRRNLRLCGDYCRQRDLSKGSGDDKINRTPVTVIVCTSLLGGFGTGTAKMVMQIVRELAHELKIPVKIILMGMVMGSLEPTDKFVAARNQEMFLRELEATMVGQFKDLEDKTGTFEPLCDSLLLLSNANNFGEMKTLDELISLVANYIFGIFHTTLGNQVLEKCVDIEEFWPDDGNGGKLWGGTASLSKIHLDVPRVAECQAHKLMGLCVDRLLIDTPAPNAVKEAGLIAAEQMLVEKGTQNMACERLFRPDGNTTLHVVNDTIRVFQDRCGSRGGFNHCKDMANASLYMLNTQIPRNDKPLVVRQAPVMLENSRAAIKNRILGYLQNADGFSFTRQFLEALSALIAEYNQVSAKRLNNAQAKKKSIDDRLSHGHLLVRKLSGMWAFFRFLSFGTKREIRNIFAIQTEQAIRTRLEIIARTELANVVFPELMKYLSELSAEVQQAAENAVMLSNDVKTEVKRLEDLNPLLHVPVGIELADKKFIQDRFCHILQAEGGQSLIASNTFTEFISRFTNLLAFKYRDLNEISNVLHDYCLGIAIRRLDDLNVIDALQEYAKSDSDLKRLVDQAIRESSGRLRTSGEGDRSIPTIKFIGIGNCHRASFLEQMANTIDKTDGQWKTFETGDTSTILFWQQRAQVSISSLIRETARLWQKPRSPQEFVKVGSCPVMAFCPTTHDCTEKLAGTIAMAMIAGQILKTDGSYHLKITDYPDGTYLGIEPDDVMGYLRNNFASAVAMYRSFVIRLTVDYEGTLGILTNYAKQVGKDDDVLLNTLGTKTFAQVIDISKALRPYLSRLPRDTVEWMKNGKPRTM